MESRLGNGGLLSQERRDQPVSSRILLITDPLGPMRRPTRSLGTRTEPSFWPGLPAICTMHSLCRLHSHVAVSTAGTAGTAGAAKMQCQRNTTQPCMCCNACHVSDRHIADKQTTISCASLNQFLTAMTFMRCDPNHSAFTSVSSC